MKEDIQVKFYFKLRTGKELILTYSLQPNSLRDRWIQQVKTRNQEPKSYCDLKIANKTFQDALYLVEKLNSIVLNINKYYDKQLPIFTNTAEINRDTLNHLHEEFELYGERHQTLIVEQHYHTNVINGNPKQWPGVKFNPDFHELWMQLNQWIHITETAWDIVDDKFPNFSCLVHIYPPVPGEPLNEIDKLFLDTNFEWGCLYLGYNTLGKDYSHTAQDNDVRVITNNQIKVQSLFSTEVWLNFEQVSADHKTEELKFWNWYSLQSQEVKELIPIDNINKLALGRYYMGQLIYDETFLNYHNDENDWLYDAELKSRWNREVFSLIESAIKIEIVE
jgi:hypothetical protein